MVIVSYVASQTWFKRPFQAHLVTLPRELWAPQDTDGAVGSLCWWGQPAHGRGWDWVGVEVSSNPTILRFFDSLQLFFYWLTT